jgi:hypothetical protein
MAITYEPIATTTLGSDSTSVVFSSIPQTYTDLIIVFNGFNTNATAMDLEYELNGDSGNNYSETGLQGTGSSTSSFRHSNYGGGIVGSIWSTGRATVIGHFMNYTNTTTYKTCLGRFSTPSGGLVGATASLWRNTSAITSINFNQPAGQSGQFASGSTFTLYGIKAA